MARSLWLFNLLLALLAVVLVVALVDSIFDRQPPISRQQAAGSRQGAVAEAPDTDASRQLPSSVPPLSDFDVIVQKDAFKSPFAETFRPAPVVRRPPPLPPLPPLPTLVGTIFVGEERKAVLSDGSRTESYTLGQPVAGGTLVKIESDRVMIQRGETTAEVLLKASTQQVVPPGTPGSSVPEAMENSPTGEGSPPSVSAPPVRSIPSIQTPQKGQEAREPQQRLTPQDRLRQLRERLPQRRQTPQGQ